MKKLTLLFAILFAIEANAQKLIKNETDKFTKQHIKETSEVNIVRKLMTAVSLSARCVDGVTLFMIGITETHIFSVPTDGYIYLLLSDDTSIKLSCLNGKISDVLMAQGNVRMYHTQCAYVVNPDDIIKFFEYGVVSMRIEIGGNKYIEYDLKEKNQWKFKDCLMLLK